MDGPPTQTLVSPNENTKSNNENPPKTKRIRLIISCHLHPGTSSFLFHPPSLSPHRTRRRTRRRTGLSRSFPIAPTDRDRRRVESPVSPGGGRRARTWSSRDPCGWDRRPRVLWEMGGDGDRCGQSVRNRRSLARSTFGGGGVVGKKHQNSRGRPTRPKDGSMVDGGPTASSPADTSSYLYLLPLALLTCRPTEPLRAGMRRLASVHVLQKALQASHKLPKVTKGIQNPKRKANTIMNANRKVKKQTNTTRTAKVTKNTQQNDNKMTHTNDKHNNEMTFKMHNATGLGRGSGMGVSSRCTLQLLPLHMQLFSRTRS